ncbi:hypothetical protein [Neisseria chenwenguii]|nr:hypothetical protein [Neisseria chenwenguii]
MKKTAMAAAALAALFAMTACSKTADTSMPETQSSAPAVQQPASGI